MKYIWQATVLTACAFTLAAGVDVSCQPAGSRNCCSKVHTQFRRLWAYGEDYLSIYLRTLSDWKCAEFEAECASRTFAYNRFTSLVYARFCNGSGESVQRQCSAEVYRAAESQGHATPSNWNDAVNGLNPLKLTNSEIAEPCIQMAMYDRDQGGFGHYHEVISPIVPFCSFVWCGVDDSLVADGRVSVWTCLPSRCRKSLTVFMVFCVIFAIAVIVANATVILTLTIYPTTRHNQAAFRFSLALADILVGIVVFPTFVSTLYQQYHVAHELGTLATVNVSSVRNGGAVVTQEVEFRGPSGLYQNRLPQNYLDFVGFFTVLSLSVSIYILTAAGFDRCFALYSPVRYQKKSRVPLALVVNVAIWFLSFIFAILPFCVPSLQYNLSASLIVTSTGRHILVLYAVMFLIPLVLMWIITGASFFISRQYVKQWRNRSDTDEDKLRGATETRLARTFGVMVGVFTLSILPAVIALLIPLAQMDIYYSHPDLLSQGSASSYTSAEAVVTFLLMCNSLWNCFIYSVRDKDFRRASSHMYAGFAKKLGLTCFGRIVAGSQEEERTPSTRAEDPEVTQATVAMHREDGSAGADETTL